MCETLNESLNFNSSFKKLRSPYCNESVQDMFLIQDLKVFDVCSEKVECAILWKICSQEANAQPYWGILGNKT